MSVQSDTLILGANAPGSRKIKGRCFACLSATGSFTVQFDNGPALPFEANQAVGDSSAKEFGKVTLKDTSGAQNTIAFVVSDSPFPLPNVSVSGSAQVKNALADCVAGACVISDKQAVVLDGAVTVGAAGTKYRWLMLVGAKVDGSANADVVSVGFSAAAGKQPIAVAPGSAWTFEVPLGEKWDLGAIYFKVAVDADGLQVFRA